VVHMELRPSYLKHSNCKINCCKHDCIYKTNVSLALRQTFPTKIWALTEQNSSDDKAVISISTETLSVVKEEH